MKMFLCAFPCINLFRRIGPALLAELSNVLRMITHCLSQMGPALLAEWSNMSGPIAHCLSQLGPALLAYWKTSKCDSLLYT